MECGACELNCPAGAITVDSGVGCAYAYFVRALTGRDSKCCSWDDDASCCEDQAPASSDPDTECCREPEGTEGRTETSGRCGESRDPGGLCCPDSDQSDRGGSGCCGTP